MEGCDCPLLVVVRIVDDAGAWVWYMTWPWEWLRSMSGDTGGGEWW